MYFDPGTGSMLIQILIATLAGVGAFLATFKINVVSFFKKVFKKNDKKGK